MQHSKQKWSKVNCAMHLLGISWVLISLLGTGAKGGYTTKSVEHGYLEVVARCVYKSAEVRK